MSQRRLSIWSNALLGVKAIAACAWKPTTARTKIPLGDSAAATEVEDATL